jgi:cytochrome bd ubiquinol oxidase subunit II
MDLNTLWFVLIAVLFSGFFLLEGFDYGVGILLPWLGKDDEERRVLINAIGPFWDGNEVWLLTAGGAIFAAFPNWYATMFSGFYLALLLMLVALILRAVAFEFRSKDKRPAWRNFWDWMIFVGSLVPALLWGVAFGNILRGVPIDAEMQFRGNLITLLNPYALLTGLYGVVLMTLHGAVYLSLRVEGELSERVRGIAVKLWAPAIVLLVLTVLASFVSTDMYTKSGVNPGILPIISSAALLSVFWLLRNRREGWAFVMTAATLVTTVATIFMTLFPRVLVSSTDPKFSLTIYSASSSPYTLTVMTVVALIFVPIVLLYQGWTYYVFRQRVSKKTLGY